MIPVDYAGMQQKEFLLNLNLWIIL